MKVIYDNRNRIKGRDQVRDHMDQLFHNMIGKPQYVETANKRNKTTKLSL